jgi:hypothetical protein
MKKFFLFAISLITIALGITPTANAAEPPDIGLNFDLAPASVPKDAVAIAIEKTPESPPLDQPITQPLSLPEQGASAPLGSAHISSVHKAGVIAELPPSPSQAESRQSEQSASPEQAASLEQSASSEHASEHAPSEQSASLEQPPSERTAPDAPVSTAKSPASVAVTSSKPIGLQFESEDVAGSPATTAPTASSSQKQTQAAAESNPIQIAAAESTFHLPSELRALFEGEENSLVARAVGSAEGTRTPDGGRTWAYQGHVDPGNKAWNRGTFSYQHQADSPEDADRKQLQRLMGQAQTLRQDATALGLQLTLEEELNGIDLANQSPRAALSRGGYIDRLQQARDMGLKGSDAVLWARTRAFLDPDTSRWNAPGLGNNVQGITADQERRRQAIEQAMATKTTSPDDAQIAVAPPQAPDLPEQTAALLPRREEKVDTEAIANQIISLDLPPT